MSSNSLSLRGLDSVRCINSKILMLAVLFIGGSISLWALVLARPPDSVVFDETYYGEVMEGYLCGQSAVMNMHPPAGKLILSGIAKALGYQCGSQKWAVGSPVVAGQWTWRGASTIGFMVLAAAFMMTIWQLCKNGWAVALGMVLLLSDSMLMRASGLLVLDGILCALIVIATYCSLQIARIASPQAQSRSMLWAILAGAAAGLALGVKWTGASALGIVLVLPWLVNRPIKTGDVGIIARLIYASVALMSALMTYVFSWWVHFSITPAPGGEDALRQISSSFSEYLWRMHVLDYKAHIVTGQMGRHPSSSPWWSWPFGGKPIALGTFDGQALVWGANAWLWSAGLIAVAASLFQLVRFGRGRRLSPMEKVGLLGWTLAYAPAISADRWMFLYHYMPASLFSTLLIIAHADRWTRSIETPALDPVTGRAANPQFPIRGSEKKLPSASASVTHPDRR